MMDYGGWMLRGGLMMVLVVIVPIVLLMSGVGGLRGGQRPPTRDETPLEILRRRYASGEISEDEFEQARRTLG